MFYHDVEFPNGRILSMERANELLDAVLAALHDTNITVGMAKVILDYAKEDFDEIEI